MNEKEIGGMNLSVLGLEDSKGADGALRASGPGDGASDSVARRSGPWKSSKLSGTLGGPQRMPLNPPGH
ncbi:MAG: hypothetical protein EA369_10000 [Bradymonadales bacterium]|nr:MAG: hypothetical protein EA369_10000 [Bradymonadales bacterium]